jgi:fructose-1,6-bisphosphatase/inositol monophosphatase family enzyme
MAVARRGQGALLDGAPVRTRGGADDDILLMASARPANLTAGQRSRFYGLGPGHGVKACASGSAGCDYLDVARGELDAVSYVYDNPWDHSAGILLVAEAGGSVLSAGGGPFRMAGGPLPFVAARDEATAQRVLGLMAA